MWTEYAHSEYRFPAPSSVKRKDVVNQCLEFAEYDSLSLSLVPLLLSGTELGTVLLFVHMQ